MPAKPGQTNRLLLLLGNANIFRASSLPRSKGEKENFPFLGFFTSPFFYLPLSIFHKKEDEENPLGTRISNPVIAASFVFPPLWKKESTSRGASLASAFKVGMFRVIIIILGTYVL